MAATNYKTIGLGNNYSLSAYFNQGERNVAENYSPVYVEAKLTTTSTRWSSSYASYLRVYWHDNRENYDRFVAEIPLYNCNLNSTYIAAATINVYHNNDGSLSGYAYATFTKGGTSGYAPNSGGVSTDWTALWKIDRYPILTKGSDFTDETNPTLNFTSYNTFPIRVKLEVSGNSQLIKRDLESKNAKSYTIELTDEERDILRALAPNSNELSVRETVCAMNGNTELNASYKDYKMTIVNANPTFINFTFQDVNAKTTALTGNNQSVIIGYSNIKVNIINSNKAIAIKKATMTKYRVVAGDISKDINYSSTSNVAATLNAIKSGVINTYAIDSRGNSTLVTRQATNVIQYKPVEKGNIKATRNNGNVGELVTLKFDGKFDNVNFGTKSNSIISATYTFKNTTTGVTKTGTTNIIPTINGKSFSFEGLIAGETEEAGFDVSGSYIITVTVKDELSTATYTCTLNSGTPNLALHKNGVGIMGKYDANEGGLLQIAGKRLDYNLIIDGPEVRTGRRVNDKWEYAKAFSIDVGNSPGLYEKESGLILSNIIVLLFNGSITSQIGNVYSLDTSNFNGGCNYLRMHKENNKIGVYTQSENYNNSKAYIEIRYIKKDENNSNNTNGRI